MLESSALEGWIPPESVIRGSFDSEIHPLEIVDFLHIMISFSGHEKYSSRRLIEFVL